MYIEIFVHPIERDKVVDDIEMDLKFSSSTSQSSQT